MKKELYQVYSEYWTLDIVLLYEVMVKQTLDKAYLEKQVEDYNLVDYYLDILRKYKGKLLCTTRYIVADT